MSRLKRMWINQPSTQQPFHEFHGRKVLVDPSTRSVGTVTAYFTEGSLESMVIWDLALSDGWPVHLQ